MGGVWGIRLSEWMEVVGRDRAAEVAAPGGRREASARIGLTEVCKVLTVAELTPGISQVPRGPWTKASRNWNMC